VKTTSAKARPPAGRKASDITAVIKATEGAGARTLLTVKRRGPTSVERIAMTDAGVAEVAAVGAGVVKVAAVEVIAAEAVAIDDCAAMGDVRVVIVDY